MTNEGNTSAVTSHQQTRGEFAQVTFKPHNFQNHFKEFLPTKRFLGRYFII